jgi:hypothetical protein
LREDRAIEKRLIKKVTHIPASLGEAILQGPHLGVGMPFAQQANVGCRSYKDYSGVDFSETLEDFSPRTNYKIICPEEEFVDSHQRWGDRRAIQYLRVAWRRRVDSVTERTLQAGLIPFGVTHVDAVHSLALDEDRNTALIGALWSSLPLDYLVKVTGKDDLQADVMAQFPAPIDHPLVTPLLLRFLRHNCVTRHYASLWEASFDNSWLYDRWAESTFLGASIEAVAPNWSMATPLRSEYERRMALVEIDAIVAVMLGLTAGQLCALYRSQFGTLRKYEWEMFFARDGHRIGASKDNVGVRQSSDETEFVRAWAKAARAGDPTPAVPEGWVKPNREAEMTRAHVDFTARLHAGEYGDYGTYLAEHPLTTSSSAAPESR